MFFSAVLVPFFTDWGKIDLFQIQLLQSWFSLWLFILEVPTGAVADIWGRKYSLGLGTLVTAIGVLIYGSVPRFEFFLLGEFLFAMGVAFASGADEAFLYDSLKSSGLEKNSKKIFAKAHTFTLLGIMFGSVLGGIAAYFFGTRWTMLFSSIPLLAASIIAWNFVEPKIKVKLSEKRRYLDVIKIGLKRIFVNKSLKVMSIDAVFVAVAGYFVIWFYQPLLKESKIPIIYFGFGHVLLTLSEILISTNFIILEKFFGGSAGFFRFSALLVAVPFVLVVIFPSVYSIVFLIVISGGFGMTRINLISAFMQKHILSSERATVISAVSMFRRMVLTVLNPIMGFVAVKSMPMALLTLGAIPLMVFVFSPINKILDKE